MKYSRGREARPTGFVQVQVPGLTTPYSNEDCRRRDKILNTPLGSAYRCYLRDVMLARIGRRSHARRDQRPRSCIEKEIRLLLLTDGKCVYLYFVSRDVTSVFTVFTLIGCILI